MISFRDCRVCLECRDFHRITGLASGSMPVAVGICFLVYVVFRLRAVRVRCLFRSSSRYDGSGC